MIPNEPMAVSDIRESEKPAPDLSIMKLSPMKRILPFVLLCICVLAFTATDARTRTEEQRRRADYYFLEALRQSALGNNDAYYKLLQRANELNPEDAAIGSDLGLYTVLLADKDSVWRQKGMDMIRRNVDEYPADVYSGVAYFSMCQKMGDFDEAIRVISRLDSIYPDNPDVAFRYASLLSVIGDSTDSDKAIGIFDRMEKSMGKSLTISMPKIRNYLGRRDTSAAIRELDALVASDPANVEVLTVAGDINLSLMRNDSALVYYNRACEADSTSGMALYKLAAYYQATGDTVRYEKEILSAVEKEDLDNDVRVELLRTLVIDIMPDSSRHEEIEQIFDNVVEKLPRNPELRKLYMSYLATDKKYAQAAEQYSYALDIDHGTAEDWTQLAFLYGSAEQNDKQKDALRQGLRYFPESSMLNMIMSSVFLSDKNYDEALAWGHKALEYENGSAQKDFKMVSQIEGLIGDVLQQMGQTDSAFAYYEKALTDNPDNTMVMNNFAYYLACSDMDLERAQAMVMRALAENPDSPTAMDTYAWVLFKRKDYEQAQTQIDRTLEIMESNGENPSEEVLHHAGDIYFFNRKHAEALDFWKRALKLNPENELLQKKVKNKAYYYEVQ